MRIDTKSELKLTTVFDAMIRFPKVEKATFSYSVAEEYWCEYFFPRDSDSCKNGEVTMEKFVVIRRSDYDKLKDDYDKLKEFYDKLNFTTIEGEAIIKGL